MLEANSLKNAKSFIEAQFPVAKVSAESYKERKAGGSQTLVGLGNWKGRKPLILVRAALLGLLLPTTEDPIKDRDVFLMLMTMDDEGLARRVDKAISAAELAAARQLLPERVQSRFYNLNGTLRDLDQENKAALRQAVFKAMPYSQKLRYCQRPEHLDGPSPEAWKEINQHLGTSATSLPELVRELGMARFGRHPRVGDSFAGGGSIPFEAARLGFEAYASDLNPVAGLLTWASLNIIGGGKSVVQKVNQAQQAVYQAVDQRVTVLGVEHNSLGWRADAYLYCVEVVDPESGFRVPLLPSFVISDKNKVIVKLVKDVAKKRYDIEVVSNASPAEFKTAAASATVSDSRLVPPDGSQSSAIQNLRRGMRMWENEDITSREDDVFVERLYCVRWVNNSGERVYKSVDSDDLRREQKVIDEVKRNFAAWQARGVLPNRKIESGYNTDQPMRERGWTRWHHLFTPRQLLLAGMLSEEALKALDGAGNDPLLTAGFAAGLGRCLNSSSRLAMWDKSRDMMAQTFSNQALNTLNAWGIRGNSMLDIRYILENIYFLTYKSVVHISDSRNITSFSEYWITDPPYADAVNYDEISEFFLAWYVPYLQRAFPQWPTDSRRELAVRGKDEDFKLAMTQSYTQLARNMPENGMQVVMFTHTSAAVWADLAAILWAAGLRVTAAWTISTETDSIGLKTGNNVQGTVLLVLRKRVQTEEIFLDEVISGVNRAVVTELNNMLALDDASDPNFGDSDYQLAAYAAALRVITAQPITGLDPRRAMLNPDDMKQVEKLIINAVGVACEHLVPAGVSQNHWRGLTATERFYLKALEVDSRGERRAGVYQELARGFGARDYRDLLQSEKANQTRLKTATEFAGRLLENESSEFSNTLTRHLLYAIYLANKEGETTAGVAYLKRGLANFWGERERAIHLLTFFAKFKGISDMPEWQKDSDQAELLIGALRNANI